MNAWGGRGVLALVAAWLVISLALAAAHLYVGHLLELGLLADLLTHATVLFAGGVVAIVAIAIWRRRAQRAEARRREVESHLRRAERLEAVGTLAGGIAHDFNNALFVITGYTEMALEHAAPGSTLRSDLEEVLASARRSRDLVRQLLAFARGSSGERVALQAGSVIKEVVKLMRAGLPPSIELVSTVDDGGLRVYAQPTEVHQIATHLCTNAAQAMEAGGGRIEVDLRAVEIGPQGNAVALAPGEYLRLTVSDTGPGIERSLLERVFEPFFTTRAPGAGTGMGLSVVHGIAARLGGTVTVDSAPGEGATFTVYLPASREIRPEGEGAAGPVPRGEGRILFVDDDRALVTMVSRILEELGFEVDGVTDAAEALERFRADPGGYDLLIADLVMPGMGGCELAADLRRRRPELPVILCTGHGSAAAGSVDREEFPFLLVKPLGIRELRRVMGQAIGPAAGGRDSSGAK